MSRDYEWHDLAKIWQTPDVGERWMSDLDEEEFSLQLEGFGIPADLARQTAGNMDAPMKDCILRLYRSAVDVGREWEPDLSGVASRGLVFWGVSDPACPVEFANRLGEDTRASRVVKLECGHWTPIERSHEVARILEEHWKP